MALQGRAGFTANGNVSPCRFVKQDTLAGNLIEAVLVADRCIGISGESSQNVPALGLSTTYHATAGYPVKLYTVGDECLLEVSAAVTVGARLGATAGDGRGVTAAAGSPAFARALEAAAAAGNKIRVILTGEDTIGAS